MTPILSFFSSLVEIIPALSNKVYDMRDLNHCSVAYYTAIKYNVTIKYTNQ